MKGFGGKDGHANYKKNSARVKEMVAEPCCYCGKGIKHGTAQAFVFLAWDTEMIAKDSNAPDYLGFHPIGSDCAKKAKSAGVPVYASPTIE